MAPNYIFHYSHSFASLLIRNILTNGPSFTPSLGAIPGPGTISNGKIRFHAPKTNLSFENGPFEPGAAAPPMPVIPPLPLSVPMGAVPFVGAKQAPPVFSGTPVPLVFDVGLDEAVFFRSDDPRFKDYLGLISSLPGINGFFRGGRVNRLQELERSVWVKGVGPAPTASKIPRDTTAAERWNLSTPYPRNFLMLSGGATFFPLSSLGSQFDSATSPGVFADFDRLFGSFPLVFEVEVKPAVYIRPGGVGPWVRAPDSPLSTLFDTSSFPDRLRLAIDFVLEPLIFLAPETGGIEVGGFGGFNNPAPSQKWTDENRWFLSWLRGYYAATATAEKVGNGKAWARDDFAGIRYSMFLDELIPPGAKLNTMVSYPFNAGVRIDDDGIHLGIDLAAADSLNDFEDRWGTFLQQRGSLGFKFQDYGVTVTPPTLDTTFVAPWRAAAFATSHGSYIHTNAWDIKLDSPTWALQPADKKIHIELKVWGRSALNWGNQGSFNIDVGTLTIDIEPGIDNGSVLLNFTYDFDESAEFIFRALFGIVSGIPFSLLLNGLFNLFPWLTETVQLFGFPYFAGFSAAPLGPTPPAWKCTDVSNSYMTGDSKRGCSFDPSIVEVTFGIGTARFASVHSDGLRISEAWDGATTPLLKDRQAFDQRVWETLPSVEVIFRDFDYPPAGIDIPDCNPNPIAFITIQNHSLLSCTVYSLAGVVIAGADPKKLARDAIDFTWIDAPLDNFGMTTKWSWRVPGAVGGVPPMGRTWSPDPFPMTLGPGTSVTFAAEALFSESQLQSFPFSIGLAVITSGRGVVLRPSVQPVIESDSHRLNRGCTASDAGRGAPGMGNFRPDAGAGDGQFAVLLPPPPPPLPPIGVDLRGGNPIGRSSLGSLPSALASAVVRRQVALLRWPYMRRDDWLAVIGSSAAEGTRVPSVRRANLRPRNLQFADQPSYVDGGKKALGLGGRGLEFSLPRRQPWLTEAPAPARPQAERADGGAALGSSDNGVNTPIGMAQKGGCGCSKT